MTITRHVPLAISSLLKPRWFFLATLAYSDFWPPWPFWFVVLLTRSSHSFWFTHSFSLIFLHHSHASAFVADRPDLSLTQLTQMVGFSWHAAGGFYSLAGLVFCPDHPLRVLALGACLRRLKYLYSDSGHPGLQRFSLTLGALVFSGSTHSGSSSKGSSSLVWFFS